jgi:hypothetical protein
MYLYQECLQFHNFYVFKLQKRSCEKFTTSDSLFTFSMTKHTDLIIYDLQPEVWIGSLKIVYFSHTDIQ